MPNKTFQTNDAVEEQGSDFNYREILDAVILHWHWFAISIIGCLFIAFLYLRYKAPVYSTGAEVLIKEDDPYKSRMSGNGLADFSQLGILTNSNGFDNEVEILSSKTLARRAVTNLKLYVRYAFDGTVRDEELYRTSPILADMSSVDLDTLAMPVFLEIKPLQEGGYHIEGEALEERFEADVKTLPVRVKTLSGWVSLRPNPDPTCVFDDRALRIYIYRPTLMAEAFLEATSIEPISKMTTIARITKNDTQRQRAEDYMNELIRVYNEDANEVKNEVALKTEAFVNKRIKIIDAELGTTESDLEMYKKRNQLVDLMSDAEAAYKGIENYQTQQIELQTQMLLVKSLKEYVENPTNYMEVIPANLGLTDQGLNSIIAEYNAKVVDRKRLLKTAPESSPVVVSATNAIASLYPGIRHSLSTVYDNLRVQKRNVDEQYDLFVGRLSNAPTQERVLSDIGRQQSVKAALYQILLQKREENAITLAATANNAKIIDEALADALPVSPKPLMIYLISLVLGIGIPVGIIYLVALAKFKIEGRADVEKLTTVSVVGDIPMADEKQGSIAVFENRNNLMSETFRNIRTNLQFMLEKERNVVLVTSTISGEGKSFVSSNLAISLSLLGKKVVIVGLDIRKPGLNKVFNISRKERGITQFLTNPSMDLMDLVQVSDISKNLSILPGGSVPPNPTELLAREGLEKAIESLKKNFDYVILDTAPVGMVTDTLLIGRVADLSVYVCRADYTRKAEFTLINELAENNKLPNLCIAINGLDLQKKKYGYYYGYGKYGKYYGYGKRYGYGYGYGEHEGSEE